mgnify:CR=1 FL=1
MVDDGEERTVRGLGQNGGVQGGAAADIEGAPVHIHHAGAGGDRSQEGQSEELSDREDQVAGDLIQVVFDPGGVVRVVVEGQLQEDGRGPDLPHFAQRCGGYRPDLVRQGVDGAQIVGDDVGGPLALDAAGVIESNGTSGSAVLSLRGGVGVEGQVEVKVSRVGGGDGVGRRHTGGRRWVEQRPRY